MARKTPENGPKPKEKSQFGEKIKSRLEKIKGKIANFEDGAGKDDFLKRVEQIAASLNKENFDPKEKDSLNEIVKGVEDEVRKFAASKVKAKKESSAEVDDRGEAIKNLKKNLAQAKNELFKKQILNEHVDLVKAVEQKIKDLASEKNQIFFDGGKTAIETSISSLLSLEKAAAKESEKDELGKEFDVVKKALSDAAKEVDYVKGKYKPDSPEVKWFTVNFQNINNQFAEVQRLYVNVQDAEFSAAKEEFTTMVEEFLDTAAGLKEGRLDFTRPEDVVPAASETKKDVKEKKEDKKGSKERKRLWREAKQELGVMADVFNDSTLTRSISGRARELFDMAEENLALAQKTNDPDVFLAEMEKFKDAFKKLLDLNIGTKKEFLSRMDGNPPSRIVSPEGLDQARIVKENRLRMQSVDSDVVSLFRDIRDSSIAAEQKTELNKKIHQLYIRLARLEDVLDQQDVFNNEINATSKFLNDTRASFDKYAEESKVKEENTVKQRADAKDKKAALPAADDEQKKKKEIQERRNKVDAHKLVFNRFLIKTAGKQMGLQDEIDSIEKSLEDALQHAHDETEFEKHIAAYNDKLSQLVQRIDQVAHSRRGAGNVLQPVSGEITVPDATVAAHNQQVGHVAPATPAKKSFWARAKEKIFGSKEKVVAGVKSVKDATVTAFTTEQGREALKKMGYETLTSILGIKIVTDAVKWYRKGEGDLHDWWTGRKESGKLRGEILESYQALLDSSAKTKKGEALKDAEKIEVRLSELKDKIADADIPEAQKKEISERLWAISIKHQEDTEKAAQAREKEAKKILDAYIQSKVSGVKIAKDALNFGLTITGLKVLRGLIYGGASLAELVQKAKKDFAKETAGSIAEKAQKEFGAKDIKEALVQSAIETARSLAGKGAKEGAGGITKATDFAKAIGTVARAFGIAHLSFNGGGSAEEQIDKLLTAFQKPEGALDTTLNVGKMMSSNLIDNALRAAQMVDPTGQVDKLRNKFNSFVADEEDPTGEAPPLPKVVEATPPSVEGITPPEAVDPVRAFAAEHGLTDESVKYLKQFEGLENNPESLKRILEASHVGADTRSHFTGSKIDNLIEAGGERRAVIFEELLEADKAAGKDLSNGSAVAFLKNQDFSSRHLGYLEQFDGKKGKFDYEEFVKNYNPEDKKMSYALFRAMQGKENTELANAGFVREATEDNAGRTVRVKGDVIYLGLDKDGKPILSGSGKVLLKETLLKLEDVSPSAQFGSAAAANEGLSTDDKLWANANAIRGNNPNAEMFAGDTANNYEGAENPKELAGIVEAELDKASFARMGEQHIDVLDRAQRGQRIGSYTAAEQHEALHADLPVGKRVELLDAKIQNAKVVTGKTIAEYAPSTNIVEAPVQIANTNAPVEAAASTSAATFSEMNEGKDLTPDRGVKPLALNSESNSDSLKEVSVNLDYLKQNYEDFRSGIYAEMPYKFIYDNADEQTEQLLRDQVRELVNNPYTDVKNPSELSVTDRENIARLTSIIKGFENPNSNPNWWREIKGDELRLAFTPYDNNLGIMANGSHAFKIMDGSKEIFFGSQKGHTFTMEKGPFNYSLVERDKSGNRVGLYNHRQALEMVRKVSTGLMEGSLEEELKKAS